MSKPKPPASLLDLYRETVLNHTIDPVGFRQDIDATHTNEQYNPLCGDRVELKFRVADEIIEAAAFDGESCAICMASASLLCSEVAGTGVSNFHATREWLQQKLNGETPGGEHAALEPLLGVKSYPARIKCALLPWTAGSEALKPEFPDVSRPVPSDA